MAKNNVVDVSSRTSFRYPRAPTRTGAQKKYIVIFYVLLMVADMDLLSNDVNVANTVGILPKYILSRRRCLPSHVINATLTSVWRF